MFFSKICVFTLFCVIFFVSGCSSPEIVRRTLPPEEQQRLDEKASLLAEKLKAFPVRAVTLESTRVRQEYAPDLVERIGKMGFNRILLHLLKGEEYDEQLAAFTGFCTQAGIEVYGSFRQNEIVLRSHPNQIIRKFFADEETLSFAVAAVAGQNRGFPVEQQLKGFSVAVAPHCFTAQIQERPYNCPYTWSEKRFGEGLDNECLIGYTLQELEKVDQAVAPLPLMVQIPDFYHDLVKAGKLKKGSMKDFSDFNGRSHELILLNSGNKPSELRERVEQELQDAPGNTPVIIAIDMAPHSAVTKGELRRRDWNDFVRAVGYGAGHYSSFRNFSGIVLGPWFRLEVILEEK